VATGLSAASAAPALAVSEPITTTTSCCAYGKPSFSIDRGTTALFQNLDPGLAQHDVVANESGANGRPLFASATILAGQAPVTGTETLNPGTYRFFCTIHPTQMTADLVVTGAAPVVAAKALSRSLEGVASSGKLKVKLTTTEPANGLSVTARRGKAKLASKGGLNLAAGASTTVTLRLSRASRDSLEDLKSATVKILVTVPGGSPVTLKQRLR
jgi:plastocyanin